LTWVLCFPRIQCQCLSNHFRSKFSTLAYFSNHAAKVFNGYIGVQQIVHFLCGRGRNRGILCRDGVLRVGYIATDSENLQ
jgi:hypothetical protein